eukprot:IDg20297t1
MLMDRSVLPFAVLARRAARPATEKSIKITTAAHGSALEWVPVDFFVSSTSTVPENIEDIKDRVLKVDFFGILPPVSIAEAGKKYHAVCIGLLKLPNLDATLARIESNDEVPGLARPREKSHGELRHADDSNQWVGAFSGLMLSLAQAGLSLVVSILTNNASHSSAEPFKTVIISALSPLCAIVRPVDATVFKRL